MRNFCIHTVFMRDRRIAGVTHVEETRLYGDLFGALSVVNRRIDTLCVTLLTSIFQKMVSVQTIDTAYMKYTIDFEFS